MLRCLILPRGPTKPWLWSRSSLCPKHSLRLCGPRLTYARLPPRLAKEGFTEGTLETVASVKIEKEGEGFRVTRSDLALDASIPGIDEERFAALAQDAKANCPISKLFNAEMTLEHRLSS